MKTKNLLVKILMISLFSSVSLAKKSSSSSDINGLLSESAADTTKIQTEFKQSSGFEKQKTIKAPSFNPDRKIRKQLVDEVAVEVNNKIEEKKKQNNLNEKKIERLSLEIDQL